MENLEIERTPPEAHDCNECSFRQESIRDELDKFGACKFFKPPFHDLPHDHLFVNEILKGHRPEVTPPCIAEIIEKWWDANLFNRSTAQELKRDYVNLLIYRDESIIERLQFLESENLTMKLRKAASQQKLY
ncbi:hypothetical protein G9A89_001142 [Geosiphon pyriformis]|nr:hypothetical protein G9A89_001142 [Geosiphon pyriformis]